MPNRREIRPPDQVTAEIVPLFGAQAPRAAERQPPITSEELAEYRRMRPLLLKMLKEWDAITASGGCPVARHVLTR